MKKSEFERRAAEMKARNLSAPRYRNLSPPRSIFAPPQATPFPAKVYVRDFLREVDIKRLSPPLAAIKKLDKLETDRDGLLDFTEAGLQISVSPDLLLPGIKAYDAVLRAAAARGWPLKITEGVVPVSVRIVRANLLFIEKKGLPDARDVPAFKTARGAELRPSLSFSTAPPPVRQKQQHNTDCNREAAISRPANVARHETARQHIDPLQEPDTPDEDQQHAEDKKNDFHFEAPSISAERPPIVSSTSALPSKSFRILPLPSITNTCGNCAVIFPAGLS